ncbi:MAG: hypothetical protein ACKVOJ_11025 [Sphingomonadaceae bacterium]
MKYPRTIQSVLLFDRPINHLESIAQTFMHLEQAGGRGRYNIPEANPGTFYRLFGGDELMITLELMDEPAKTSALAASLSSAVTQIMCADMADHIAAHRSHILINVSHGALGDSPEIARLLAQMDYPMPGSSLPQFQRRLEVCAQLTQIAQSNIRACAVHWTQSNMLLTAEAFDVFASLPFPSHLHIHPILYGGQELPNGDVLLGVRTFGATHIIDREVLIKPSHLPWAANFEVILAFLRVAIIANGYVIPDGDTFGPDDNRLSYRVIHVPAGDDDIAYYELEPLLHREYGFQSDSYVPRDRVIDDRSPPPNLVPRDRRARETLIEGWQQKRALAEGIGGQFEVRAKWQDAAPTPPRRLFPGVRAIFGRKSSNR